MEIVKFENYSFKYPNEDIPALSDINLSIKAGEFITVCGKSGCGKSTLLRSIKPIIAPHGTQSGRIILDGKNLLDVSEEEQVKKIGFVLQNPDNQIVTDKVWHELAFGLESLGMNTDDIRIKVAETASFFGIQKLFHDDVSSLSGGQKQLLNLASVMVMQPDILILDEPTSQLDPISAEDFIKTLLKINKEIGTTIILSEHRLNDVFPISDRVLVLDYGQVIAQGTPADVGIKLKELEHEMFFAIPAPIRVFADVPNQFECPLSISDGRRWLSEIVRDKEIKRIPEHTEAAVTNSVAVELKNVWFKYQSGGEYILKDMMLTAQTGEIYSVVGGNGTGKTTLLSVIAGDNVPQRGKVFIYGEEIKGSNTTIAVLPQNPQTLFIKKTVEDDLTEMLAFSEMSKEDKQAEIDRVIKLCELGGIKKRHPYDLSGGEQQRAALAKILLLKPKIILLDEPTKGIDASFKARLADILNKLKDSGVCIVIVSHDIEFCAQYSDRCGLMFDGVIVSEGTPNKFFSDNNFYTTAVNRMSRGIIPNAILAEDIINALGQNPTKIVSKNVVIPVCENLNQKTTESKTEKKLAGKIFTSFIFGALFFLAVYFFHNRFTNERLCIVQAVELILLALAINPFLPKRLIGNAENKEDKTDRRLNKRTFLAMLIILLAVPMTIFIGFYILHDRKYYFISMLIIFETMIPFFFAFENRKPKARELVVISVLCAIAVAGRMAFYMLPQFKPIAAIVIIAGVAFGGEAGFLVGAITGFVSNFFFGQGPWTPWQMFAFGIIGFLAGALFKKGLVSKTKTSLCIFGGLSVVLIYGGIMNPASAIMFQGTPNIEMILSSYVLGMPFDIVHGISTVFFLWILSEPFIEKLDRIKTKYGLIK